MTLTVTEAGADIPVEHLDAPVGDVDVVDVPKQEGAGRRVGPAARRAIAGFLLADVVLGGLAVHQHAAEPAPQYTQVGSVLNR